jgi:uncharacterized protein (DUF362 family)
MWNSRWENSDKAMTTRKEFLRILTYLGMTSVLPVGMKAAPALKPRQGKGNLFMDNGSPILVVVEGREADRMLAKGLEALGGLANLLHSDDRVFIKPNYGSHRAYPTGSDPNFLVSIAAQLRQYGDKQITICDSSDGYVLNRYDDPAYVFKENRVFEIGREAGVEVICTHPKDEAEYVPVYSDHWEMNPKIKVNRQLLQAPIVVNQPMLKKHGEAKMTCALKNFFGAVYQPQRMNAHKQLHENGTEGRDFFMKTIAEFADVIRPELTIVDARQIMTVRGPSLKEGSIIKEVNRLILSGDMVATDAYCATILDEHDEKFTRETVDTTLEYAHLLGLGERDLRKVTTIEVTA